MVPDSGRITIAIFKHYSCMFIKLAFRLLDAPCDDCA